MIRRYKNAYNLTVIVRKRKKMYIKGAKEKNLNNKSSFLYILNFNIAIGKSIYYIVIPVILKFVYIYRQHIKVIK